MESIERHVILPTDLETAWELLTRPDDLGAWLGAEVVLDPTPGAAGIVVDHDGTRRPLVIDAVDTGRRLSWRWWSEDDLEASRVEIVLSPAPEGTRVAIVEHALPTAQASARASAAWSHRLLHLEALLLVAAAVRG
jgi:uncharacterized protein YndB with AHSA1/START domain